MATARPRTAGLRQSIMVPFTPNVEVRDENEAHILRLQLPEFHRQQVMVRVLKGGRTVKVIGERQAGDDRWIQLDETYPIPEFCAVDKITAQLKDGVVSITMPKQTIRPVTAPEVEAVSAPPPSKQPEQSTLEKGREEISPDTKAEIKEPEAAAPVKAAEENKGISAELQKQDSEKAKKEAPTPAAPAKAPEENKGISAELQKQGSEKAKKEAPTPAAPVKAAEENKGISAELQKQGSEKAKEEAPTPTAAVAKNDLVKGDSGQAKTTLDQKISSPEKKEIENQNLKKRKDSKTEEVGKIKNEDAKIGTGTQFPRATRVGRMPPPATVSFVAAVVIAVAAYLQYS